MNNTTETPELLDVREPRSLNLRGRLLVVLTAVLAIVGLGSASAFADTDATGGLFSSAQSSLTTVIIPAAAALVLVGIVFAVAVKWMSKAMKKG